MARLIELKGDDMHDGRLRFCVHECGIAMYDVHIRGLASVSERSSEWIVANTMLL